MNNIPRTFCITLERSSIHKKFIQEQVSKLGLQIEFFNGVDGKALGLIPIHPNILEFPNDDVYITGGSIGCSLSHLTLWKTLQYLPESEFFVVEDDAIFPDDFVSKFEELYKKVPSDWEMIYVGWITYGKDICPIKICDGISSRYPSATHAYIVKKSVLSKLIESLYPLCSPIDLTLIKKVIPNIKCYVFDPSLVSQKSYLNVDEPDWFSEGYDWKLDKNGLTEKILSSLKFGEGWHRLEILGNDKWRWSGNTFTLYVPTLKNPYNLQLTFTSEKDNELTIIFKDRFQQTHIIVPGKNIVDVKVDGINSIKGILEHKFIPSEEISDSKDTRVLGLCLWDITLNMDQVAISGIFDKIR